MYSVQVIGRRRFRFDGLNYGNAHDLLSYFCKNSSTAAEDYAKSSFTAVKSSGVASVYRASAILLLCLDQPPLGGLCVTFH